MKENKLKGMDIPELKHKKVYTQEYVDKLEKEKQDEQTIFNAKAYHEQIKRIDAEIKLKQAKEIIRSIIRVTWGEGWNYSLDVKVKAEQFLKE